MWTLVYVVLVHDGKKIRVEFELHNRDGVIDFVVRFASKEKALRDPDPGQACACLVYIFVFAFPLSLGFTG